MICRTVPSRRRRMVSRNTICIAPGFIIHVPAGQLLGRLTIELVSEMHHAD